MNEFCLIEAHLPDSSYKYATKDGKGLEEALEKLRGLLTVKAFDYAPINRNDIDHLAQRQANKIRTPGDFRREISSLKPNALRRELAPFVQAIDDPLDKKKGDERDFAVSCYLATLKRRVFPPSLPDHGTAKEKPFLRLTANLNGWVIVKKVEFEGAKREEILAGMASMRAAVQRKLLQINGIAAEADAFQSQFKRASYANLPLVIDSLPSDAKKADLLLDAGFEINGFAPFVSIQTVNEVYPALKIPKLKGRMKKS
ncbi:hypothetical protein COX86_00570 [Candidatus Micrarchaeota archaeon CG_4_10_14_0_2_um_filter_60_11]|nr:MAG: hypothetical protein COX86_00570 [Candidatus Micrarchaeota archaeon CG_4_10_14_0_2_um_filter_60_11]